MNLYKPTVTTFETNEQMYQAASDIIVNHVLEIIGDFGMARIALSGGNTPLPLYTKLFNNPFIEHHNIEIFQTDERITDPNSPLSNQYNIRQTMGENINYFKEVYFMNTEIDAKSMLNSYIDIVDSLDGEGFDLTILGVGEDGHIASLFPNGKYLSNDVQPAILTDATNQSDAGKRVSLSAKTLLQSKLIVVLLVGDAKKHIIPEILEGRKSALEFPAKFLLQNPNVMFLESFESD